jgi:hypothetical protein
MAEEVVIFTQDPVKEVNEILARTQNSASRRIFVYGKHCDVSTQRSLLPDWEFTVFEEAMQNQWVLTNNTATDVFVLHHCHPAKVPDRNLGVYQTRAIGQKIVVEEHPFCGKAEPWYLYFPYSYIDKTLLGYPHCYAFRDARTPDPYNPVALANKLKSASVVDMQYVFQDIQRVDVSLSETEHQQYQELKRSLFDTETTPKAIIRGLHNYVKQTTTYKKVKHKGLPLLDLNRLWAAYKAGNRQVVVTDAKVDLYLYGQLQDYVSRANAFMSELGNG